MKLTSNIFVIVTWNVIYVIWNMAYLGKYRILSAITNPTGKKRFEAGTNGRMRKSNAVI